MPLVMPSAYNALAQAEFDQEGEPDPEGCEADMEQTTDDPEPSVEEMNAFFDSIMNM